MNNLIYIIKQEGLSQNKVTVSLASFHNRCKVACRAFFTHVASIYANLLEQKKAFTWERVKIPAENFLGTPTWLPFHCFGTPIWPPWRHVKTLYSSFKWSVFTWRHGDRVGVPRQSCGNWTLFLCKNFLLFQWISVDAGHVREIALYQIRIQ